MQTKFLHKLKWYKPFLVFCVLVIQTPFINQVFAQQVTVNFNTAPHNKLWMESLWDLTIFNTTQETLLVYLYATLEEVDAGDIANGTSTTFALTPGVRKLTGADYGWLAPQIDYTNQDPSYKDGILRTGEFRDGDYTYCAYVRLASSNENIGFDCKNVTIEKMPAPSLISPDDGDALVNKNPVFTWMHSVTPGTDVNYKIKIIEIIDIADPYTAMENNPAWFEEDNIRTTVFQYPTSAREFLDTITYAWQVTSLGPTGEHIGENDGKSEVWGFTIGEERIIVIDTTKALIPIDIISPAVGDTTISTRPNFEWVPDRQLPSGAKYNLKVVKLGDGQDPEFALENNAAFLEIKNLNATRVRYPEGTSPLDSGQTYIWEVSAYDSKNVLIAKSRYGLFSLGTVICKLWYTPEYIICQNGVLTITFSMLWLPKFRYRLTGPWTTYTGWSSFQVIFHRAKINLQSQIFEDCGKFNFVLKVWRAGCLSPIIKDITVYVIPNNLTLDIADIGGSPILSDICTGDAAELIVTGGGCSITGFDLDVTDWHFRDRPKLGSWGPWEPWGSGGGNPMPTNRINIEADCPTTPPNDDFYVEREYRATLSSSQYFPTPWPADCPNEISSVLKVWCPTNPGTITITPSPPGTEICSNFSDVDFTLTLSDYLGEITGWWVDKDGGGSNLIQNTFGVNVITRTIPYVASTSAGTYTFTVRVKNGTCDERTAQIIVTVADPVTATIVSDKYEVCANDDATLTSTISIPYDEANIRWQWDIDCDDGSSLWEWNFAGTGPGQNTNEIGDKGAYIYKPVPPTTSLCWRLLVEDEDGICDPTESDIVRIDIIQAPCASTITTAGPNPKCPGSSVTLSASTPLCGTGTFTYQWLLDGEEIDDPLAKQQTYTTADPGNYQVIVYNKNNCDFSLSEIFKLEDCDINLFITGPCCTDRKNDMVLTAVASPNTCGSITSYIWSPNGETTNSITIPAGSYGSYSCVVTTSMGCTVEASIIIICCPQ